MSFRALLYAVRDQMRASVPAGTNPPAALALRPEECEVMHDHRPMPRCGQRFVSISRRGRQSGDQVSLDEYYAFDIAVTYRVNGPFDRWAFDTLYGYQAPVAPSTIPTFSANSVDAYCDAIRAFIHADSKNYFISNLASQYLGNLLGGGILQGDPPIGFVEPIAFIGDDEPRPVGPDHFSAEPDSDYYGVLQVLHFGKSRRKQSQDAMT